MKNKIVIVLFIVVFLTPSVAVSDDMPLYIQKMNIPKWVVKFFNKSELSGKYDYSFKINPMYLRGDFNGDNRPDIAILVKEKATGKTGVVIAHDDISDYFVLGAGNKGVGGDDLSWMSNWYILRKDEAPKGVSGNPPPDLQVESIRLEKAESANITINWNGKEYVQVIYNNRY